MITIDAFRIGAKAQLESYGNIMQIPVAYVDNRQDLRKEIALHAEETDLFLIDTIGKSPKDSAKLGEMKEILEGCGRGADIHLVLCASTKTSDIEDTLRQFEPFNYRSVVLTKMDETNHIGNVISALAEKGKSVSYITDGQKVPNDIKKATVVNFLINLDEFMINRDKIEERFPPDGADQFKWS
jgi:flagellar biosynthesis protein FlhF